MNSLGKLESIPPDLMATEGASSFSIEFVAEYESQPSSILLHVLLLKDAEDTYTVISTHEFSKDLHIDNLQDLALAAVETGTRPICLSRPFELETVSIPKPWGQELWYSGIEKRGVSTVGGVPLSWLLAVFGRVLGCQGAPMLLKILDPFPEPNLGDLYFEMHEKKIEVYVVTHIDPDAWPAGYGQIRYGFNQDVEREFQSTNAFLESYRQAVADYQAIRDDIDSQLKPMKSRLGLSATEPLQPAAYKNLLAHINDDLVSHEEHLRQAMYRYTAMQNLGVGDVVTIAPMVPHSLQHGVRVIEFQTPHYERYILSFGQEVLTQDHWDTDVLSDVKTAPASLAPPVRLAPGQDTVADFDEFRVIRVTLPPEGLTETHHRNYTMIIGVSGEIVLDEKTTIGSEQAFFMPPKDKLQFRNAGTTPATVLVAEENS